MSTYTKAPWLQKAAHITNDQLNEDENYRRITAGDGFFDITGKEHHGFCLTGYMSPMDSAILAAAVEMYEAMKLFCDRVEAGEVRSKKTYESFKAIIDKIDSHA